MERAYLSRAIKTNNRRLTTRTRLFLSLLRGEETAAGRSGHLDRERKLFRGKRVVESEKGKPRLYPERGEPRLSLKLNKVIQTDTTRTPVAELAAELGSNRLKLNTE